MVNNSLAPVVIFAYNRPDHLRNCLESLSKNRESLETEFFVSLDGPRNPYDQAKNTECISVLSEFRSFKKLEIWRNETNLGLSRSILGGVNRIFEMYSSAIFVEDDLVVSRHFLKFMNEGLNLYELDFRVASIHGYQYPIANIFDGPIFLRGADCWGWATWKSRWETCSFDAKILHKRMVDLKLAEVFDLDGTIQNTRMLLDFTDGKNDSWAIRWHAEMFLSEKYTVYPPRSLAKNVGSDGSGINSGTTNIFDTKLGNDNSWSWPTEVFESKAFRTELKKLFIRIYRKRKAARLKNIFSYFIPKTK